MATAAAHRPPPLPAGGRASDSDKAGVALLFSGVFLCLVGSAFTALGWLAYDTGAAASARMSLEWAQLLGPVLLAVGGTFALVSVCKFNMLSSCPRRGEDGGGGEDADVFADVNQPVTFHGATAVQCVPPPYASVANAAVAGGFQGNGDRPREVPWSTLPQYYATYPQESRACATDDNQALGAEQRECRVQGRRGQAEETKAETPDAFPPPAYEDLYPSLPPDSTP